MTASVQIFGVKDSPATRSAERFFKERRVQVHFVDLDQRGMAPAEIKRFTDRFGGLHALLDAGSKAYADAGMQYLKMSEAELRQRIEREPRLLRLPLVRRPPNRLSIGADPAAWKEMLAGS